LDRRVGSVTSAAKMPANPFDAPFQARLGAHGLSMACLAGGVRTLDVGFPASGQGPHADPVQTFRSSLPFTTAARNV
jgi:hypothetical protein